MKVKEITVSGGAKWNHPHESYSNLHTELAVRAELEPGEDPEQITTTLQERVAVAVEVEKRRIIKLLDGLRNLEELDAAKEDGRVRFATVGPANFNVPPGYRAYLVEEEKVPF